MRIHNPYSVLSGSYVTLRGNLHAHTTRSDGSLEPQDLVDAYARRGYDYLAITDHDLHAEPELVASLDARGMLLLPGNEITMNGPHVLHVFSRGRVEPSADRQLALDAVGSGGGFALLNHPNWQERFDHWPIADMRSMRGYLGIEIFNGVITRLPGSPYAAGKWDMLLGEGMQVWGFANDDFHNPAVGDMELGWNVAFCGDRTIPSLERALGEGSFYASTGVTIRGITVEGQTITVQTEDAQAVVALVDYGRRIAASRAASLTVKVPEGVSYVRFECHGVGEAMAWTQPFRVER